MLVDSQEALKRASSTSAAVLELKKPSAKFWLSESDQFREALPDQAEDSAGTDKCEPDTDVEDEVVVSPPVAQPPTLALTGPSTSVLIALIGAAMLAIGAVTVTVSRRVEA